MDAIDEDTHTPAIPDKNWNHPSMRTGPRDYASEYASFVPTPGTTIADQ
jgi:hypothetical protein